MAIDMEKVLPIVTEEFPDSSPEEIKADIEKFMSEHPDMTNLEALVALYKALHEDEGMKDDKNQEPMPQSDDEKMKGVLGL